jgi:hypothetical protein
MIDEDRTYENEVRVITMIDWVVEKIGKIARAIFHWTWRVQGTPKILKKEKVNEFYINNDNM